MLKKLRNRSLTENQCEQMEFAKKLRISNNGKINVNPALNQKMNQEFRKISANVLNETFTNIDKNRRQIFFPNKENLNEVEEFLTSKKRKKMCSETFPLVDERNRTHFFPLFRENQYPMFKHESFIPIIELVLNELT